MDLSDFFGFLKTCPSSPLKNESSLFARREFQGQAGHLPHILAMIKINWDKSRKFVKDCIRASVLDIIKVGKINRLIDEGPIKNSSDVNIITNLAKHILSYKCSPRCLVMVDENNFFVANQTL